MFFLLPTVGSLVDSRAYFALNPGGTSSLEQTLVPLAAYSSRTVNAYLNSLVLAYGLRQYWFTAGIKQI